MSKELSFDAEEKLFSSGYEHIFGCDEVGRGCLAGPVVAATVYWNAELKSKNCESWTREIKDSKLLSPKKRALLAGFIKQNFVWAIGEASVKEIDEINIHNASLLAMQRSADELHTKLKLQDKTKTHLLIDGRFKLPDYTYPQTAIVDGDAKIFSIASSSIVAKVYRDELMTDLDKKFPGYEFAKHKGYGTKIHKNAIIKLGPSIMHRKSFKLM